MRRMTRGGQDRGSTAVIVAVSFMMLLTVVGLSVDVGAAFAKRQEAQNGADAAALAVASQCLINRQDRDCTGDFGAAADVAELNERADDTFVVEDIDYDTPPPHNVTVTVSGEQAAWFIPALSDTDSFTVRRSATVNYGSPVSGTTTLPLAAGNCIFPDAPMDPDDEVVVEIWLPPNSGSTPGGKANDCRPDFPAGGFAWLSGPNCTANISVGGTVPNDPGKPPPSACPNDYFSKMVERQDIVFIPLFDISSGSGNGAVYQVTRFAVFQVTGFHSQHGSIVDGPDELRCTNPPSWAENPSGGVNYNNTTCFKGKLLGYRDDPGDFELGGPITEITFTRMTG